MNKPMLRVGQEMQPATEVSNIGRTNPFSLLKHRISFWKKKQTPTSAQAKISKDFMWPTSH